MYPISPTVLPLTSDIVRTGIPVATLLLVATILIVLGLFARRGAALARTSAGIA